MMHTVESILIGILVLSVVVFVHELGHYLAARWRHIKVDVFSIGFGPALTSWYDRAGTRWQLSALPLGGYVKLHGFGGDDSSDEAVDDDEAFHRKPVLSRAIVTVMGPVFNFIFTIIIFIGLFGFYGHSEVRPDVGEIEPGSVAQKAGLHVGDHLTSLNGRTLLGVADLQAQISAHPGENVTLGLSRQGQDLALPLTLGEKGQAGHKTGYLGVRFSIVIGKALPFYEAVPMAFEKTWDLCVQVLQSVWQIISGQRSASQLSGTIGIIHASGQVAHYGWVSLLLFVAAISTSLGLFNLFPIPMLDGGHLVFYAAEAIMGRPVSERVQGYALQAGLSLVLVLFLFTGYNDLRNLGFFHKIESISHWVFSQH
ncbi:MULTISPECIES: RIP metalloprotease RseP [unclassified Saccharibacter]|uniref:RIP metalloprotease RseP n=1 Tax=unclassified Saccharibacter TaxID=2648722 RepID=UPI001EF08859|nr:MULTISPECIES: RIP metalloprotease RseP [unclassified Saccharibacter]